MYTEVKHFFGMASLGALLPALNCKIVSLCLLDRVATVQVPVNQAGNVQAIPYSNFNCFVFYTRHLLVPMLYVIFD